MFQQNNAEKAQAVEALRKAQEEARIKATKIQRFSYHLSKLHVLRNTLSTPGVMQKLTPEDFYQLDTCDDELETIISTLESLIDGLLKTDPVALMNNGQL